MLRKAGIYLNKDMPFGWTCKLNADNIPTFYEEATGKTTFTDPRLAFSREPKASMYDFKQRFDASSNALQVLYGVNVTGKIAVITGCNCGIGFETARSLALHGCEIIFACRSKELTMAAIQKINEERPQAKCEFYELDLCSIASVQACALKIRLNYPIIDILILNAGIFGASYGLTEDNYEKTFQTNHLAQFYFTLLLKPVITSKSCSRIIIVSSESHRFSRLTEKNIDWEYLSPKTSKGFISFMAYNDSKLCNILFAQELDRRWGNTGVTINAIHPGNMVSTNLARNGWLYQILFAFVRPFTKSLQQAASTTIWAAVAEELEGVSANYFNNCWQSVPSSEALNLNLASKLWEISVEMIEKVIGKQLLDQ